MVIGITLGLAVLLGVISGFVLGRWGYNDWPEALAEQEETYQQLMIEREAACLKREELFAAREMLLVERISVMSKDSMELIRASSLEEKVQLDMRRNQYKEQLEYMRDAAMKPPAAVKNEVKLGDGSVIDLNQWDIV
jgi:hypothetical protein